MVTRICRIEIMAFEQNLKRMKETTETVSRKEYLQQIPGLPIVSNHIHGQNPDLRTPLRSRVISEGRKELTWATRKSVLPPSLHCPLSLNLPLLTDLSKDSLIPYMRNSVCAHVYVCHVDMTSSVLDSRIFSWVKQSLSVQAFSQGVQNRFNSEMAYYIKHLEL